MPPQSFAAQLGASWGWAIAERFRSDSAPILQPQSDTRERKAYVLFVLFVAKTNRSSFAKGYGGQEGNKQ